MPLTSIDDNAHSHLGVPDGAATEQETLTAKTSAGMVWVFPGEKKMGQDLVTFPDITGVALGMLEVSESPFFASTFANWEPSGKF